MAFWGAPSPDPDQALHACRAALAIEAGMRAAAARGEPLGELQRPHRPPHRPRHRRQCRLDPAPQLHRTGRHGEPRLAPGGGEQGVRDDDPDVRCHQGARRRRDPHPRDRHGRGLRPQRGRAPVRAHAGSPAPPLARATPATPRPWPSIAPAASPRPRHSSPPAHRPTAPARWLAARCAMLAAAPLPPGWQPVTPSGHEVANSDW